MPLNPIVVENLKPGNPQSEWDLNGPASSNIEGFATDISVNHGSTVDFKINTDSTNYRIDIYRLGYYGGDGARLVGSIQHQSAATIQPAALTDSVTGLVDAGNWHVTDSWSVPADAVSGVYIAKLVRQDGVVGENHIPFIVRADGQVSDVVFQTSDPTWEAYNPWGTHNVYDGEGTIAVSYNRPTPTHEPTSVTNNPGGTSLGNYLFGSEYAAIYWLEKNGYDVSYMAGVDTARNGSSLLDHKLFLSVGHDEYWSAQARSNVEAARDAGVNLAFWSGNEVYWKTRWDVSMDPSHTDYRTMVAYKDVGTDPTGVWTGRWGDPAGAALGSGEPANSLTGQFFTVNYPGYSGPLVVPYADSQLRFWRDTAVAATASGGAYVSPAHYLGFEIDSNIDNGYQPAGLIELSHTQANVTLYGGLPGSLKTFGPGTATHELTLYRAPSGALVFGAGAVFWSWALDTHHDPGPPWPDGASAPVDRNIQQAMVNLFADMGIQPGSIQSDLKLASATTDFIAPTSAPSDLAAATYDGSAWTIHIGGTAQDVGGKVAGVSVSLDNGATWHGALTDQYGHWSYDWVSKGVSTTYTLLTRAVDDSINVQAPHQTTLSTYDFSLTGYMSANPDVAAAGVNGGLHFSDWGWKEYRNPNPNFDVELYLLKNPDVAAAGVDPYQHFLQHGISEGRVAMPSIMSPTHWGGVTDKDFDEEYYLLSYPDVGAAKVNAYQHYLDVGWKEGRNPNAYFDTSWYLAQYPDVAASGIDPLTDYHTTGWKLGRNPSPNFDTNAYLAANPDVAAANVDPLMHFLKWGAFEGRAA